MPSLLKVEKVVRPTATLCGDLPQGALATYGRVPPCYAVTGPNEKSSQYSEKVTFAYDYNRIYCIHHDT